MTARSRRRAGCSSRQQRYVPWTYWLGGGADLDRRHADHRQPGRQLGVAADDLDHGLHRWRWRLTFAAWFRVASGRCRSTPSSPRGARRSTGSPSCSPSRSAPPRATSCRSSSALGYLATGILFGLIIASLALGYFTLGLDGILGFWLCYIFTRPLGASFGDLLSQPVDTAARLRHRSRRALASWRRSG